jgi:cytochrome c-type protein NapC
MFGRIRRFFSKPSNRWGFGTLLATGFLAGALTWAGFLEVVASTNTLDFCISCHEMRENPYAEYRESAHFATRSGVRPNCADCHVPSRFFPKMATKIRATYVELPAHLMGKMDTPEKYDARREHLAERVWARMRADDSAACRSCHDVDAMSAGKQALRAVREHEAGFAEGDTCIDCHQGIAHRLPESMLEEAQDEVEFDFGSE